MYHGMKVDGCGVIYTILQDPADSSVYKLTWESSEGKGARETRYDYSNAYILSALGRGAWTVVGYPTEQSSLSTRKDGKMQSDGGSSAYYDLTITNKEGQSLDVRTGDIIRALVGNDFDFGNCIKALRRMYLCTQGQGKEGTDLSYDANKVRYFVDEIENTFNSKR